MPSPQEWDDHWLRIAQIVAHLSKDPSTKVGAAIVTPDNRQCSIGYNGFPKGVEEFETRWERPEKYDWVVHAELNAITNCPFDTKGCYMYVTHQPCHRCLASIVNAGITKVFYGEEYKNLPRVDVWDSIVFESGIKVVQL